MTLPQLIYDAYFTDERAKRLNLPVRAPQPHESLPDYLAFLETEERNQQLGDTLLLFVFRELSDVGGVLPECEAAIATAIIELERVRQSLENACEESTPD